MNKKVTDLFDPYAMIYPKTEQDYRNLLDEAVRIAEDINDTLDKITQDLEKNHGKE